MAEYILLRHVLERWSMEWKVTLILNTIKSIDKVQDETHCCCLVLIFDVQLNVNLGKASNVHDNLFIDNEA